MITVKLIKDARIKHSAGDIVCVSPVDADFLIAVGVAELAAKPAEKKTTEKKTAKK